MFVKEMSLLIYWQSFPFDDYGIVKRVIESAEAFEDVSVVSAGTRCNLVRL